MTGKVYIVSVNFNSVEHISRCADSLIATPFDRWVIVDNSSTREDEISALMQLETSRIRILPLTTNGGFGAGVNAGVAELAIRDEDVVWILNPDTTADKNTLSELVGALADDPEAIVSPVIVDASASEWFAGGHIDLAGFRVQHREPRKWSERYVPFIPGTALAMRGKTWHKIEGFREDLFMYWEDADLCLRALNQAIPLRVVKTSSLVHMEGASSRRSKSSADHGRSKLYYYYVSRNRIRVARDWGSWRAKLRPYFIFVSIAMLVTPIRQERDGRWQKAVSAAKGLVDGALHR